ncbi:MAG: exodeoxyribonuclease V subunit gamma, partial [Acidobacteria bacterium]|nr:exodeoxyribonuclease V subunit gamma [Candidatus Polarisedimenticola svalbardensis]
LLGVHLNLLRKMEPVTVLLPFDPTGHSPAGEYAQQFASKFLINEDEQAETVRSPDSTSLAGARLASLYDEDSRPQPMEQDRITLDDFQGAATEVTWAVRRAIASGTDPKEICILARDLSRYGPALEEAFRMVPGKDGGEPVWTGSLTTPLRRDPVVHDALVLLQVVSQDFPRGPTVELLSTPRMIWQLVMGSEPAAWSPDGAAVDRWSRRAGILGGLDHWIRDLPREAGFVPTWNLETEEELAAATRRCEQAGASAQAVVHALAGLHKRFQEEIPTTWSGHADRYRRMLELLPDRTELNDLLDDMANLDRIGDDSPVTGQEALSWLEQAVDDSTLSPQSRDRGGIRVLDAMQARGLTFSRLYLIGFHAGSFPRIGREDPFLDDRLRRQIQDELGRPLASRLGDGGEERLLLALMLGSTRDDLHLSWQRADDTGRAVSPSAALREMARAVLGVPDTIRLHQERVRRRSVHPHVRLAELGSDTGMLHPEEAHALAAFSCEGTAPDPAVGAGSLGLSRQTLAMLQATERFRFGPTGWDGRVGPMGDRREFQWSTTALEDLGRCPLRFFFRRVLKVEELEGELSPLEIAPVDMGTAVHKLLELVYSDLNETGSFAEPDAPTLVARAGRLLDTNWDTAFRRIDHRVADHLRPLWRIQESIWKEAVVRFLETDLTRLSDLGPLTIDIETYLHREIDLGDGVTIHPGGKFDRLIHQGDTVHVADYKTSGRLGKRISISEMLKGNQLQVPIYHLLAEQRPTVELLGVGPGYAGPESRAEFTGFARDDQFEGLTETLRVLAGLLSAGLYPIKDKSPSCSYCAYKAGCRINHPPTLEREAGSKDSRDFIRLAGKNSFKNRTLLHDLVQEEGS